MDIEDDEGVDDTASTDSLAAFGALCAASLVYVSSKVWVCAAAMSASKTVVRDMSRMGWVCECRRGGMPANHKGQNRKVI